MLPGRNRGSWQMSKPFIPKGQALWFTLIYKVTDAVCDVCHQTKEVAGRYASEKTPDIVVCSECARSGEAADKEVTPEEIRVEMSPKPGLAVAVGYASARKV